LTSELESFGNMMIVLLVEIGSYMEDSEFKESNFAIFFKKWSEGKISPSKGLGSPFVFE
tara:strand:- start:355 stop:531 length:177 start_codon:yes stop_codon:yes gene_type:complete